MKLVDLAGIASAVTKILHSYLFLFLFLPISQICPKVSAIGVWRWLICH